MLWHIPSKSDFVASYITDFANNNQVRQFELEAGDHSVMVYNREDGSRIDSLTFDCQELEPTPSTALASTTITYTLLARGAGFDHALRHNLPFADGGQYTLDLYDGDGNPLSSTKGVFDGESAIEIFGSSKVGLPPYDSGDIWNTQTNTLPGQEEMVNGHTAVLTFSVNNPEKYLQSDLTGFPWDLYLPVHDTDQEVHMQIPGHMDNLSLIHI